MSVPADRIARLSQAVARLTPVEYPGAAAAARDSEAARSNADGAALNVLRQRLNELRAPGDTCDALVEVARAADAVKAVQMIAMAEGDARVVVQDAGSAVSEAAIGVTPVVGVVVATGTVVLDLPTPAAGYASLLVEHHVAVAHHGQLFPDVSACWNWLAAERRARRIGPYQVCVTGCSRTADIEKLLVVPAHGPKRLTLILSAEPFAWEAFRRQLA